LCCPPSGERSQALSSAISIAAIVRRPNCSMFEISADSSLLGSTPFPGRLLQMLRSSFREASVRHRFKAVCIKRTVRRLNRRTTNPGGINDEQIGLVRTTLAALVCRIEVQRNQLVISVKLRNDTVEPEVLSIPLREPHSKRARKILLPHGKSRDNLRPERAERRARLVCAIARRRRLASGNTNWFGYRR